MIPWTDHAHEQAMAGAAKYLYGRRVKAGRIVRVRNMVAYDITSTVATAITIGIEDGGRYYKLASWIGNTTALQVRNTPRDFWLRSGQRVYAYFQDATSGDDLYISGYGFETDEGKQATSPG